MNKWLGIGNIARDPEYGTTQSGIAYCKFTVACQRRFKNAQGQYEADFINCVAWRQTADFVNNWFRKGDKIALEGSIQVRAYDAQDGSKRWVTEVTVEQAEFAGSRKDGGQRAPAAAPQPSRQQGSAQQKMDFYAQNGFTEVEDDELPF